MARDSKSIAPLPPRSQATVERTAVDDVIIVAVAGLVDERFHGFGDVGKARTALLDVSGMTRMTSFGVRQWLKAMDALPKTVTHLYLVGCPTFFVDQLNMVLNFGGTSKILTVVAPYTCTSCGVESGELIDVLVDRANLEKGGLPDKRCARCDSMLEFDETPESYFAFVGKYGASSVEPTAAKVLAEKGLYTTINKPAETEKPPRVIKLVHGTVTYFRVSGAIGAMFRARPFLVGAEGEIVIDLSEVEQFDFAGLKEWRRLLKSLTTQVASITLVDVNEAFLATAGATVTLARNVIVASLHVPFGCIECNHTSKESVAACWPVDFGVHVCALCGGNTGSMLSIEAMATLEQANMRVPEASANVIAQRTEIVSRALDDARLAQAESTSAAGADDTILGKYKIVRRLSDGGGRGITEVFLAKQVGIGGFEKQVVLKRIQRGRLDGPDADGLLNEAKLAGRLMHPNIVQVLDVGEVQDTLYLVTEHSRARDLREVLKKLQYDRTTMPIGDACYVVREIAQALQHAFWSSDLDGNRLGAMHRDVSPKNIVVGYDGSVKLADFGVAMSAITEQQVDAMGPGRWLFMSPEETQQQPIDHRSDLYSLGVILYLLISGQLPFTGRAPKDIVKKIKSGRYKPLANVPEPLARLIERLLSPEPDERPQTGEEIVEQLTEIARANTLGGSATTMARFLTQLLPNDLLLSDAKAPAVEILHPRASDPEPVEVVDSSDEPEVVITRPVAAPAARSVPVAMIVGAILVVLLAVALFLLGRG